MDATPATITHAPRSADNGLVRLPRAGIALRTGCVAAAAAAALVAAAPAFAQGVAVRGVGQYQVNLVTDFVPEVYAGDSPRLLRALRRDARVRQGRLVRLGRGRGVRVTRRFWVTNTVVVRATPQGVRWLRRSPLVASVVRVVPGPRAADPARAPIRRGVVREAALAQTFPNIVLTGAPDLWALGATGQGVRVGVMDTEIDAGHPVFGCSGIQVWTQGAKCGRVVGYGDFSKAAPFTHDPGEDSFTGRSHGTRVTSVLAGGQAGSPARTWGVAPGASVLFAKVVDSNGSFDGVAQLAAAQWFADPDGDPATRDQPGVVNGSFTGWAGNHPSDDHRVLVRTMLAADIVPVFGAGNSGPGSTGGLGAVGSVGTPSWEPEALSVGNTDNQDVIAPDSSRGCASEAQNTVAYRPGSCTWKRLDLTGPPPGFARKPDLVAPGVGIPGACDRVYTCTDYGGGFGAGDTTPTVSGTSLSSPTVAGVAVLLRQRHPAWNAWQVMNALRFSAVDLGPVGWDPAYGHGRVRAVEADAYVPDTTPPVVSRVSPEEGSWLVQARVTYQLTPGQDIGDLHTTGDVTQAGTSGGVGSQVVSWDPATGVLVMDHGLTGTTGPKDVVFRVTDTSGNTTRLTTRLNRDITEPTIQSTTTNRYPAALPVRLTGTTADTGSGVSHVVGTPCDGGASFTVPVAADGSFTYERGDAAANTQVCVDFKAVDNVGLASTAARIYSTYSPPFVPAPQQPGTGVIPPAPAATPPRPVAPAPAPGPVPVFPPAPVKQTAPAVAVSPQVRTTGIARLTPQGVLTVPVRVAGRGKLLVTVPGTTWRRTITVTAATRQLRLTLPRKVAVRARKITLRTTKTTRTIPLARPR